MLHAVVGDVEAAVAAEDHVPAVARVDPEGVVVGVDAAAAVGAERLAAVGRAVERDPQHVEVLVVGRIDADLAEVHRPGVEAVDPRPGLAAVGRLVDAAVLEAVGPLLVLDVLALAAEPAENGWVGSRPPAPLPPRRRTRAGRAASPASTSTSSCLLAAADLELELVAGACRGGSLRSGRRRS